MVFAPTQSRFFCFQIFSVSFNSLLLMLNPLVGCNISRYVTLLVFSAYFFWAKFKLCKNYRVIRHKVFWCNHWKCLILNQIKRYLYLEAIVKRRPRKIHFIVFGCIYLYLKKLQLIAALTFLMVFHSRYARFVTKNAWRDDRGNRIKDDINLIHWYWTLFALLVFSYWNPIIILAKFSIKPKRFWLKLQLWFYLCFGKFTKYILL